ncbi:unnamed protein product [Umbelopsis ramanniana]
MGHHGRLSSLLALLFLVNASMAFYLPGVAPHNYKKGDLVPLYVNLLTPIVSSNSQLKSVIRMITIMNHSTFANLKVDLKSNLNHSEAFSLAIVFSTLLSR